MSAGQHACLHCLRRHPEPGLCPACEADELLDLSLPDDRELWRSHVYERRVQRRTAAIALALWALGTLAASGLTDSLQPLLRHGFGALAGGVGVLLALFLGSFAISPGLWLAALFRRQPALQHADTLLPADGTAPHTAEDSTEQSQQASARAAQVDTLIR